MQTFHKELLVFLPENVKSNLLTSKNLFRSVDHILNEFFCQFQCVRDSRDSYFPIRPSITNADSFLQTPGACFIRLSQQSQKKLQCYFLVVIPDYKNSIETTVGPFHLKFADLIKSLTGNKGRVLLLCQIM